LNSDHNNNRRENKKQALISPIILDAQKYLQNSAILYKINKIGCAAQIENEN